MTEPVNAAAPAVFSPTERRALRSLRRRYRQDRDLFSCRERAQLLFLRWLYRSGHFLPSTGGKPHRALPKEVAA